MATTTTNFGWDIPQSTDLVKDGATAIAALGQDIDTAFIDLKGGTTGQVLAKASNTDLDFTWATDASGIPATIFDAKGDLIAASAADTAARLAVGTNGQVLTADSSTATGLKWATAAGGGKVLQVVSATYSTNVTNTTGTFADTGLSASITPSATTSKILVLVSQNGCYRDGQTGVGLKLLRGSTDILLFAQYAGYNAGSSGRGVVSGIATTYLDSPATTSSTTYKTQLANPEPSGTVGVQGYSCVSTITLLEIGA
jgi:hypothetical protein